MYLISNAYGSSPRYYTDRAKLLNNPYLTKAYREELTKGQHA